MPVYKMQGLSLNTDGSIHDEYYRVGSTFEAICIARYFGYELDSVVLLSEDKAATINSSSIETIDASWLLADSPLVRRPVRTIALGVALGMLIVMVVAFVVNLGWTG